MVHFEVTEIHQELDGPEMERYSFTVWSLREALLLASEWVSWEGLSWARRTATVYRWPDVDEIDDPDCAPREVAYMTWASESIEPRDPREGRSAVQTRLEV